MDSTERHRPGPLPSPPADFAALRLPIRNDRGPWIRQHGCRRTAAYFGKTGANRFDAPNGEYGVLYAGADEFCAFIEVYGDPLDHRLVARRDLNEQCWSRITVARLLRLVDLTGAGARRIGLDGRISTENHAWTQRWAL
ncbi:MAG: RES family NAD+ phosphorylase, partial [Armatimonadota bacterium]